MHPIGVVSAALIVAVLVTLGVLAMRFDGADKGERRAIERDKRAAAGLGFWRLVWIVALGILIAQGIGAAAIAVFRALAG